MVEGRLDSEDAEPSAPPVAPGHSACPQQLHDTGDDLLNPPKTPAKLLSATPTLKLPSMPPVSRYPSPAHLPHNYDPDEHKRPTF